MLAARALFCTLIPLLASCQLLNQQSDSIPDKSVRLQGELSLRDGQWLLRPCQEQRHFVLQDNGNTGLAQDAAELIEPGTPLFADLRGQLDASPIPGNDGQLEVLQRYRLQRGQGCDDPNFKRLTLHASGPSWSLAVSAQGMVLDRPGQPSLALPYLEEQLPDGRFSLTSEANGQRLELWVAPQRCVDERDDGLRHLSAELRLDGQIQRGCAYYGGARRD